MKKLSAKDILVLNRTGKKESGILLLRALLELKQDDKCEHCFQHIYNKSSCSPEFKVYRRVDNPLDNRPEVLKLICQDCIIKLPKFNWQKPSRLDMSWSERTSEEIMKIEDRNFFKILNQSAKNN